MASFFFPLEALPNDILVIIFACVAEALPEKRTPLQDLHNIRAVSRRFRDLAYNKVVLERVALDNVIHQWRGEKCYEFLYSENFLLYESIYDDFLNRCIASGNPQALDARFQLGVRQFFLSGENDTEIEERGLRNVEYAAKHGLEFAAEVYGVFLLTLGVEHHRKAYDVLAPYVIQLTPNQILTLRERWRRIERRIW